MPCAENQGVRINYQVDGTGPALVLQHGFTQNLRDWYQWGYVDALKAGYRLILIDARGHGASDKPRNSGAYRWPIGVMDVLAVLNHLDLGQAVFWGYSMGGSIGLGLAKHAPERVAALVVGGASAEASNLGSALRHLDGSDPEAFVAAFEARLNVRFQPEYRSALLASDTQALAAAAQDRPSMEDVLPKLGMPCLFYVGESDGTYSRARSTATRIPHATFVSLPGLNHAEAFRRADLVLPDATSFLSNCRLKT